MESLPFWELTWLAGTSTIWRCFPVEHWDFPNDHLSFQGCHSFCFHQSYRNNWKVLQGEGTHPTVTRRVTLKSVLSFDLDSTKTMTRWPWYLDLHRESECLHPEFLIRTHACLMYCFFLVIPQKPCRANVMGCLPKPSSNFKPCATRTNSSPFIAWFLPKNQPYWTCSYFPLFSSIPSHPHCNLPLSAQEKKGRMRPATAWRSSEWKQISAQHKDRTLVMAFEGRFAIWRCWRCCGNGFSSHLC